MTEPETRAAPWLFGPVLDLLLGCGAAYGVLFALMVATGTGLSEAVPMHLMPFVALAFAVPHYGATLLRVYENREDRKRYALFGTWLTGALVLVFAAALWFPVVGSLLLTVYITWSPWHYSGQNYGLTVMFLARRGVEPDARTRRALYATFVLSFLLSVVAFHSEERAVADAPIRAEGTVYEFLHVGIPDAAAEVIFVALLTAWMGALAFAGARLVRQSGSVRPLGPAAALVASQALWFVVPTLTMRYGWLADVFPLSADHHAYAFLWIAMAHSVQYLWVSAYFARRKGTPPARFLGRALLGGAVAWVLPGLLFAPALGGPVSYEAGLGVVIASVVNLHHFILDGVIWKLRDGPVARILLRGGRGERAVATPRRATGIALWVVGGACIAVHALGIWEVGAFAGARDRADVSRMESATGRLGWIGRDGARVHRQLGDALLANTPRGDARFRDAALAYERALELDAEDEHAIEGAGVARARQGRSDLARAWLARAREVGAAEAVGAIEGALGGVE